MCLDWQKIFLQITDYRMSDVLNIRFDISFTFILISLDLDFKSRISTSIKHTLWISSFKLISLLRFGVQACKVFLALFDIQLICICIAFISKIFYAYSGSPVEILHLIVYIWLSMFFIYYKNSENSNKRMSCVFWKQNIRVYNKVDSTF